MVSEGIGGWDMGERFRKLPDSEVERIRELRSRGWTLSRIEAETGISRSTMRKYLGGKKRQGVVSKQLILMRKVVSSKDAEGDTPEMGRLRKWMEESITTFMKAKTELEGKYAVKQEDGVKEVEEKDEGTDAAVAVVEDWFRKRGE